jgi:hypothetical protein
MWTFLQPKLSAFARCLAGRLQRYVNRLSTRTLWVCALIFFIGGASLLSTLVILTWRNPGTYLSIQAIDVPAYVLPPISRPIDSLRQQAMLRHLQHLLYQVDSLRTHPETKVLYDSLLRLHPGLWDSLIQAQNLFLHPFTITP